MEYLNFLLNDYKWLMGENISMADISAAAHLSVVDYLGEVPWEHYPQARDWYAQVKSRPAFRPILGDKIFGYSPPKHYANLDF